MTLQTYIMEIMEINQVSGLTYIPNLPPLN